MSGASMGRALVVLAAVVIAATVVAAVMVTGSPGEQRASRLDERRVQDLRNIDLAIDAYAGREGRLPESLATLPRATGRSLSLVDPVTASPYGYEPQDRRRYRLCADFTTDTRSGRQAEAFAGEGWRHPVGRHCFERAVEREAVEPDAAGATVD